MSAKLKKVRFMAWNNIVRRLGALAAGGAAATLLGVNPASADPNALWNIVHGRCAPHEQASGEPAPCLAVDLAKGYAVLKDIRGKTQVLVIPTARVTGIESPLLLAPHAPNYWQDAWEARRFVAHLAGRPIPRGALALAVNSVDGRSQNQLHIHVDCLKPNVRDALTRVQGQIGRRWAPLPIAFGGRHYMAMRLEGADLGARNPFKLLAEGQPTARKDMGLETLVAIPTTFENGRPGFILLSDRANLAAGDYGSGEVLQDHACKVLGP